MNRLFTIHKYKLIRVLGQDIWGSLLLKYSDPYTSRYKIRFRNVCNFVILEYERRFLFDFRNKYRNTLSFVPHSRWKHFKKLHSLQRLLEKIPKTRAVRFNYLARLPAPKLYALPRDFNSLSNIRFLGYSFALTALFYVWRNAYLLRRKQFSDKRPRRFRFKPKRLHSKRKPYFNRKQHNVKGVSSLVAFAARFSKPKNFGWYPKKRSNHFVRKFSTFNSKKFKKFRGRKPFFFKKFARNKKFFKKPYHKIKKFLSPQIRYARHLKHKLRMRKSIREVLRTPFRFFSKKVSKNKRVRLIFRSVFYKLPWRLRRPFRMARKSKPMPHSRKTSFFHWIRLFILKKKYFLNKLLTVDSKIVKTKSVSFLRSMLRPVYKRFIFKKTHALFFKKKKKIAKSAKIFFSSILVRNLYQLLMLKKQSLFFTIPLSFFIKFFKEADTSFFFIVPKVRADFSFSELRVCRNYSFLHLGSFLKYRATAFNQQFFFTLGFIRKRLKNKKNLIFELNYNTKKLRFGDYEDDFRIPPLPRGYGRFRSKKQFRLLKIFRLRTFYGIFNLRDFKKSYNQLVSKTDRFISFFQFLECRLAFILYLTNLFPSMYFIDNFIKHGKSFIKNETAVDSNYMLSLNENFFFSNKYRFYLINILLYKLFHQRLLLNAPRFIEMNYILPALSLIAYPSRKQLTRPFSAFYSNFDAVSLLREW